MDVGSLILGFVAGSVLMGIAAMIIVGHIPSGG